MDGPVTHRIKYVNGGPLTHNDKVRLFARFINHQYAAMAILFEIVTGQKPPKLRELLRLT